MKILTSSTFIMYTLKSTSFFTNLKFSRKHLALGSKPLEIISNHTMTYEAYTQDVHLHV